MGPRFKRKINKGAGHAILVNNAASSSAGATQHHAGKLPAALIPCKGLPSPTSCGEEAAHSCGARVRILTDSYKYLC